MSKHTPGPWKALQTRDKSGWTIASVDNGELCDPVVWEQGGIDHEPNARLIAAAPALLGALEQAAYLAARRERPSSETYATIIEIARAAIALAKEGRQ